MITVVCTGGEAPPDKLCSAWFDRADRRVAADSGLALLRRAGRVADLWIGDGDSLEGPWDEWSPWAAEVRKLDRAKDDSDTEAAVKAAAGDEVWLVGGGGGRMDHWWANLRLFASEPRLTRWLTGRETARRLDRGQTLPAAAGTVSVFPLGQGPWELRSEGLRWPLAGVDFSRWHSLANQAEANASVTSVSGSFLVLQLHSEEGPA